jgi:hypothetical protein
MEIFEHTDALALLGDADLFAADVGSCAGRLEAFAARYLRRMYHEEHRAHALTGVRGKLTGLQRKTTEPIAAEAGQKRRLQLFVDASGRDERDRPQGT